MSMTENEAIAKFKRTSVLWESATNTEMVEAVKLAIQALTEIQAYRAIGTIDEFKALKEKNEPIANGEWIDTQPGYNNGYYKNVRVCSNCHDYYTTEYDEMKFCPKCGSKMTET